MQGLTLSVALVCVAIVLCARPLYGLIVFITAMAWYPQYLSVPVGSANFTLHRIVILAILLKVLLGTDLPGRFKLILLDKLVLLYFTVEVLTGSIMATSLSDFLLNRSGAMFDMVFPYFAVRFIVRNKEEYFTILKWTLVVASPLAIVGLYQSITGNNPVGFLQAYNAWVLDPQVYESVARSGFYRANVTIADPILYGLFFAAIGPMCAGLLRSRPGRKYLYWVGLAFMGVGIFSSMSSGPMMAGILSLIFIFFYRWRKYWKPVVVAIVIMCLSVEIISNRHFYDVLGSFTLDPQTAWYRSQLIDVAMFRGGMSGHWLIGFGYGVDPGWNLQIDGRNHTDIVNHYLCVLCNYGLVGLISFLAMNIAAAKRLVDAYKGNAAEELRWTVWCLSASLFGFWNALTTVSLFGQLTTTYFVLIGFAGVAPAVAAAGRGYVIAGSSGKRFEIPGLQKVAATRMERHL